MRTHVPTSTSHLLSVSMLVPRLRRVHMLLCATSTLFVLLVGFLVAALIAPGELIVCVVNRHPAVPVVQHHTRTHTTSQRARPFPPPSPTSTSPSISPTASTSAMAHRPSPPGGSTPWDGAWEGSPWARPGFQSRGAFTLPCANPRGGARWRVRAFAARRVQPLAGRVPVHRWVARSLLRDSQPALMQSCHGRQRHQPRLALCRQLR